MASWDDPIVDAAEYPEVIEFARILGSTYRCRLALSDALAEHQRFGAEVRRAALPDFRVAADGLVTRCDAADDRRGCDDPHMRRHANFVAGVSAGLLVIGFGLIPTRQASEGWFEPAQRQLWFRLGIGRHRRSGRAGRFDSDLRIASRKQTASPADTRRHELKTGEKLKPADRSSPSGRHRLEMAPDGNVIEWDDRIFAIWKTDTQRTDRPGLAGCRRRGLGN